jgi:hypothetical protein
MSAKDRIRELEKLVPPPRDTAGLPASMLTDEELAECIGGHGTLPEDISDEDLQFALANHGRLPDGWQGHGGPQPSTADLAAARRRGGKVGE